MKESAAAGVATASQFDEYYRWVEPDSDITVCLRLATMDRLQRAVLRSIDSFSEDRMEVGGILIGRTERRERRTLIFVDDFEPVACEHVNGPAYVLTAKDEARFAAAMARTGAREGRSVVGYYRSHNRERLFLTADDLRLIQRHFSGQNNLFLLVKALANTACTAGFFFWKHGHIQNEFTDSEVPLIPTALSATSIDISSTDPVDAVPATSFRPVLHTREEPAAIALANFGRRRDHLRLLKFDLPIFAAAAAVTFVALAYLEKRPAAPGPVIRAAVSVRPVTPAIEMTRTSPTDLIVTSAQTSEAPVSSSPEARTFVGPQLIDQVVPVVPRGVRRMITTDVQVDVAVIIDANGKVISALVAATQGAAAGLLTIEAVKAAQSFRFRPARKDNNNVPSSTVVSFRFAATAKYKE